MANLVKELQAHAKQKEQDVELYHLLTAMTITNKGSKNSFDCHVVNSETDTETRFHLTVNEDGTLTFVPLENPKPLPSFLHGAIEFEKSQCPEFFKNVLGGMFQDE
eukprot:CAMPEP_0116843976 /NCGR_PEP_ID=MMETSP0418-20121206/12401_1 /TAXON_ID=1158023 /ORGANISM="Astrosyne radiata, Strain 13vi08-1A" /LENGTH=105 /DNA_ID=CAMNT_0004474817 /DNA_START=39 /DNA_END=356 /DNA_ORIENTATION=+